jgi:hypothetical protein
VGDAGQAGIRTRGMRRDVAVFLGVSLLARIGYWALGVRFDFEPVSWYWQFLDPEVLTEAWGASLVHLHSQPPLLNGITGLGLIAFGAAAPAVFQALFWALGIAFDGMFFSLSLRLLPSRVAAWIVGLLVLLNPAQAVYENNYFYTHPVQVLLVAALFSLERSLTTRRLVWLATYGLCLLTVVSTRSMFHPVWLAAGLAIPLLGPFRSRRAWAVSAAVLVLGLAWPLKNWLVFDAFTSSSWAGMNLYNTVYNQSYTAEEMRAYYAHERVPLRRPPGSRSVIGDRRPFAPPAAYERYFEVEPRGVAALDRTHKASGHVNFNHAIYLPVSDTNLDDYWAVVAARPTILWTVFRSSLGFYFRPATDYPVLDLSVVSRANLRAVETVDRWYKRLVYWQVSDPRENASAPAVLPYLSWFVVFATVLVAVGMPILLRVAFRGGDRVRVLMGVYLYGTLAYVFVVGNLFENYENMRFRFETEPLLWSALVLMAALMLQRQRGTRTAV